MAASLAETIVSNAATKDAMVPQNDIAPDCPGSMLLSETIDIGAAFDNVPISVAQVSAADSQRQARYPINQIGLPFTA